MRTLFFLTTFLPLVFTLFAAQAEPGQNARFNHLPYAETAPENLIKFQGIQIHKAILPDLQAMINAAKKDDVNLIIRSGFRSIKRQEYLFYEIAKRRGQTLEERAKVSAPPGHSEHHTGMAVDFDDADDPKFLEESFAETDAGIWLMLNANRYNFHLSFPKNNPQGIAYEPWHWLWKEPQ